MCQRPVNGDSCFFLPIGVLLCLCSSPGCWRSRLPLPVLERLAGITTGLLLLHPQLEELALLPAALVFRRPLARHVLVLACLDQVTGDFGTEDRVVALAARLPVMVHQFVTAGHAFQK